MARVACVPMEARGAVVRDDPCPACSRCGPRRRTRTARSPSSRTSSTARAETIRVIVPDVGGAFGTKGNPPSEVVVAAIAAMDLGRPVKWTEDRLENLQTTQQGRGMQADVEMALDADGRILGVRAKILADLGAYLWPSTPIPPHTAAMLMGGGYDVPAVAVEVDRRADEQGADRARTAAPGARRATTSSSAPSTTRRARSASTRSSCAGATSCARSRTRARSG